MASGIVPKILLYLTPHYSITLVPIYNIKLPYWHTQNKKKQEMGWLKPANQTPLLFIAIPTHGYLKPQPNTTKTLAVERQRETANDSETRGLKTTAWKNESFTEKPEPRWALTVALYFSSCTFWPYGLTDSPQTPFFIIFYFFKFLFFGPTFTYSPTILYISKFLFNTSLNF